MDIFTLGKHHKLNLKCTNLGTPMENDMKDKDRVHAEPNKDNNRLTQAKEVRLSKEFRTNLLKIIKQKPYGGPNKRKTT